MMISELFAVSEIKPTAIAESLRIIKSVGIKSGKLKMAISTYLLVLSAAIAEVKVKVMENPSEESSKTPINSTKSLTFTPVIKPNNMNVRNDKNNKIKVL